MKKTKKIHFSIVFLLMLCLGNFSSCLNNDNDTTWPAFNSICVTVKGDELLGYKLYTDFDAVLIPVNFSQFPVLKEAQRALVSFDLPDHENITQLEAGKSYDIILSHSGVNQEIPTFITGVDISSEDYKTGGKDSIALTNKVIHSFNKEAGQFYVKNGYLNLIATFDVDPNQLVYFSLYYDGEKEVDVANKKLTLNLYFNNNTDTPYGSASSILSFKMPEDIFNMFLEKNIAMTETIEVTLKAHTQQNRDDQLQCKTTLKDFLLPGNYY
jgi:hypothetical protein